MTRVKKLAVILFLFIQFCSYGQNWMNTSGYFSQGAPISLYTDTATNELYATGYFQFIDTIPAYGLAKWNGTKWENAFAPTGGSTVYQITKFQGEFYVSGTGTGDLYKWDGSAWQSTGVTTGSVRNLYNDGDSILYALGIFTSIDGVQASNVAKFNGTNWTAVDTIHWAGGGFSCAIRYQGDMYFCGGYNTAQNLRNLFRWDGQQWHCLGTGIVGGTQWASALYVYNNYLFVGGYFDLASGNPGNYIARWNGTDWTQVGGGMLGGQVWGFIEYNGDLWATGQFAGAGGISATFIAKYDGLDWCSVGVFDSNCGGLEIFNGELYVSGGFWTVDGDSVNKVIKWIGGNNTIACGHLNTGIAEDALNESAVSFFPNPIITTATFQFSTGEKRTISIYDQFGREIWRKETDKTDVEFSADGLANGMYFFQVIDENSLKTSGKFIVQR